MWAALVILASCAVAFAAGQGDMCLGRLSIGVDNVVDCPVNCSAAAAANASVMWCLSPPDKCFTSESEHLDSSIDLVVNDANQLVVSRIPSNSVVETNCTYVLGDEPVCEVESFQMTQTIGKLEFRPVTSLRQIIANGKLISNKKQQIFVGVTLVLCYTASVFGYNDSPVYWTKDGESFSNSTLITSEENNCIGYLNYLQSNPELSGLDKPVQSFINLYRSDPCLLYIDQFIAILRIQSLQLSNMGTYALHFENLDNLELTDELTSLENIEYFIQEPLIEPFHESVIEIREGSSSEAECNVSTSVGVVPVWMRSDKKEVYYVDTNCQDAACLCTSGSSANIFFTRITNEIHESTEGALILQHNLILFICNANQNFSDNYTCLVNDSINDFALVNVTLELVVASVESNNRALIISVGVAGAMLLLVMVVIVATVAGCCLYIKKYLQKSREDRVVDLPIPGHLTPYCYDDLRTDDMEFPRDSLIQLEVLGEGQFGQVFKAQASGIVPGDNTRNIVAVKTVKENALSVDISDLYAELEIMKKMEPHPNILNLLGYCTRPFNDPPLIIMEFALHGNLKSFLRRYKRALFRLPSDASSQYSHSFTALSREHTPAPNSPVAAYPSYSAPPSLILPTLIRPPAHNTAPPIQSIAEYLEICGSGEQTVCSCEDGQECSCDAQRDVGVIPVRSQWNLYSNLPLDGSTVHRHHLPLDEPDYYNQMGGSDYQYQYQYDYQSTNAYYNLPGPHQLYYNQSHAHSSSVELGAEGRRDSVQQSPPATSVCSCDWEGEKVSFTTAGPETDVQNGRNLGEVDSPRPISQKSVGPTAPGGLRDVDFLNFALQISHGMEHLERMKCLHRDLAARNVLIAEGFLLKIADFGLARELTDKDYYRKRTSGKLPARWMAIESLSSERIHTHKSDVWSFGVLLWEIFTYGSLPYGRGDVASTLESLLQHLVEGHRLPKPDHCSNDMYQVMRRCWVDDPSKRPSFSQLVFLFDHMLSTAHGYLQMSEEESMQMRSSLDRLIDQRRRPSMELIVEESPNTTSITVPPPRPLPPSYPQTVHPRLSTRTPSRDSNSGSSSGHNHTSSMPLSSVTNGNVMMGATPSHRPPPLPLTNNLQETTV